MTKYADSNKRSGLGTLASLVPRLCLALCGIALLPYVSSCKTQHPAQKPALSEPGIQDTASVNFDIETLPAANGSRLWLATYKAGGKLAKFRIELIPPSSIDSESASGFNFKFGNGDIKAEPGSDASVLLADLGKALDAKKVPRAIHRASELKFTYAILGENQSLSNGGGFADKPTGDWTAMKVFFLTGDDDAEVFLNFNAKAGKAQFSEKDPDYGNDVLAKLATVL